MKNKLATTWKAFIAFSILPNALFGFQDKCPCIRGFRYCLTNNYAIGYCYFTTCNKCTVLDPSLASTESLITTTIQIQLPKQLLELF